VDVWDARPEQQEMFVAIAAEFAPVFGKQIRIHNYSAHVKRQSPIDDGRLHICIWASPEMPFTEGSTPGTLFGAPIRSEDPSQTVLNPGSTRGQLYVDEDGNQFGMQIRNTVYIHYRLNKGQLRLQWDGKGSEALFKRMLEEIVFITTATEEERAQRARAIAAKGRVQSREAYINSCNGRFNKALESTQRALEKGAIEAQRLQEQLVRKIREQNGHQRKLQQMTSSRSDAVEAYGKEFDRLLEVPKVRDVRVRDGVVQVFTDTLYCDDPRTTTTHEIGHFRIEFQPNGTVRWVNLDRQVNNMQAPHVFPDGTACLGNMHEVIPELVANYEYAALVMVCIQFVESVNVDDSAGTRINDWPIAAR